MLVTLGIDRIMSFWTISPPDDDTTFFEVNNLWGIEFLGGKVTEIVSSSSEKNKILLNCHDRIFKSWDLEKKVKRIV